MRFQLGVLCCAAVCRQQACFYFALQAAVWRWKPLFAVGRPGNWERDAGGVVRPLPRDSGVWNDVAEACAAHLTNQMTGCIAVGP